MAPSEPNPKVDTYLSRAKKWPEEMAKLRAIILPTGLTEELKWGKPCYALDGKNIVLIVPFKDYCSLIFPQGALLNNSHGLLIQPTEHTQAARRIHFTSIAEITRQTPILKTCLREAIEVEKAGLKVEYKQTAEFKVPEELQSKFKEVPAFKTAFHALTPGRQRAYILHFAAPKQSKTRESRIEKLLPQILQGKGLNDDYTATKKKK